MLEAINQVIDTLYNKVMEMPNKVLDVFNYFFGEEKVDMQGFPIKEELKQKILLLKIDKFSHIVKGKLYNFGLDNDTLLIDIQCSKFPKECTSIILDSLISDSFIEDIRSIFTGFILVHFPKTTVTNEHGKSTIVKHLYIKVPIDAAGTEIGTFTMNRSEYTVAEMYRGYMHSHAQGIPYSDFTNFVHCCLGSGPLRNTQTNLAAAFDEDKWRIFCLELSKYVEVESIAGRPYHRLESITLNNTEVSINIIYRSQLYISNSPRDKSLKLALTRFFRYYLDNNNLTFSYRNGMYSIGMPYIEYLINISNSFIEWINNHPEFEHLKNLIYEKNVLLNYALINNKLYYSNITTNTADRYKNYIGKLVCTFKGNPITVSITDINSYNCNTSNITVFNYRLASYLLYRILTIINYRYGRNEEDPDTIAGKVRYKI